VGKPYAQNSNVFEDVMARLTYQGLVFSKDIQDNAVGTSYKMQFHPGLFLYIPSVLSRHLPPPEPVSWSVPGPEPERVKTGDPAPLLRDLYLYWEHIRQDGLTFIKSGLIGKRGLKVVNASLLSPDPSLDQAKQEDGAGRLYLLRQLLEGLKLARRQSGRLVAAGKNRLHVPQFWSWTPAEQLSACLEVWPKVDGAGGLDRKAAQYYPVYTHARTVVGAVIKELPAGVWLNPEEVLERVQERDANFLFLDHTRVENTRGRWYYGYSGGSYYGNTRSLLQTFEKYEKQFVLHCLTGFLNQIGTVELGYDGNELLGIRRVVEPASGDLSSTGKLIIQPNFHIMAMGPVSAAVLAQLDLFAERQRADRGVFEYHLSRESVYAAQQLGMEPAAVIRFLAQASDTEFPQNVRRSLEEWVAHSERIVFRSGVNLMQTAGPDLLADLMEGPHTGKCLARAVSPTVAVVKQGRQPELISALVSRGLFPAVSSADPEAADQSVIVQVDGAIRPIHAVPSLHLRGRLSRLAEETAAGDWRLTPKMMRQIGGSKNKVLWALGELRKLHRGRLPTELVDKIKAWGGYYGDAAVETLTLLQFRDRSALDELCQHRDLRDKLAPFPTGSQTAVLAVVRPEDLAQVRKVLAQHGVSVQDGIVKKA